MELWFEVSLLLVFSSVWSMLNSLACFTVLNVENGVMGILICGGFGLKLKCWLLDSDLYGFHRRKCQGCERFS